MYTSDDRGILFSKSLERHLFDGQRKSDFTNITSLRGVYLTNKLDVGEFLNHPAPDTSFHTDIFDLKKVFELVLGSNIQDIFWFIPTWLVHVI